jgi:hypothetical protein
MPVEPSEPEPTVSEPVTPDTLGKTTVGVQQPKPGSAWSKGSGHALHQQLTRPRSWVTGGGRPEGWLGGGGRGDRWWERQ